jgi:hypothetical protein
MASNSHLQWCFDSFEVCAAETMITADFLEDIFPQAILEGTKVQFMIGMDADAATAGGIDQASWDAMDSGSKDEFVTAAFEANSAAAGQTVEQFIVNTVGPSVGLPPDAANSYETLAEIFAAGAGQTLEEYSLALTASAVGFPTDITYEEFVASAAEAAGLSTDDYFMSQFPAGTFPAGTTRDDFLPFMANLNGQTVEDYCMTECGHLH